MKIVTKKIKIDELNNMANIGSEIERAISWKNRNNEFSNKAVDRGLELLFLSIEDKKNISRLKELTRVYEGIADYFYNFAYAVRNKII